MLEHMFLFTFNQRNEHVSLSTFVVILCVLCIKPIEVKATRQELWPKNAENRNRKKIRKSSLQIEDILPLTFFCFCRYLKQKAL